MTVTNLKTSNIGFDIRSDVSLDEVWQGELGIRRAITNDNMKIFRVAIVSGQRSASVAYTVAHTFPTEEEFMARLRELTKNAEVTFNRTATL